MKASWKTDTSKAVGFSYVVLAAFGLLSSLEEAVEERLI